MTSKFPDDLRDLIDLLNVKQVLFIVAGSHAVAFYGHRRAMRDLDLCIDSSAENVERLIAALVEFGFEEPEVRAQQFADEKGIVTIDVPPHSVDFHNRLRVVSFAEAWAARVAGLLGDRSVFFISKELLIKDKQAAGRDKDLADVAAFLEADTR